MPLGMEVGLGPVDTVLDEDKAPLTERGRAFPPLFGPCLSWPNGRPPQQLLSSCYLSEQVEKKTKSELANLVQIENGR